MKNYFQKMTLLLIVLFSIGAPLSKAQINIVFPLDMKSYYNDNTMKINMVPNYTGDTLKLFDGNQFDGIQLVGTDSLTITIQFDSTMNIEKSKIYFWHNALWSLESAMTLSDLDSETGTYNKLISNRSASAFSWDSSSFASEDVKFIRLRIKNPSDSSIRIGEWALQGCVTFEKYVIFPQHVLVIPNTSLKLDYKIVDAHGRYYPSSALNQSVLWQSENSSIARVDESGVVTGVKLGMTNISISNITKTLNGTTPVSVVQDFKSEKVKPMTIKVILVNEDPMLPSGNKLHDEFGWHDPSALASSLVKHFLEATDSTVNFKIVETINESVLHTRYYGKILTVPEYVQLLKEPGWPSLKKAADSGQIYFDYREFVNYYHFDDQRNNGDFDEIWVYSAPYLGMYESQLMGPNAFWWNSPPIKDGTSLTKLLSIMGLNYERGVDLALHSFGHRIESAMTQAYLQVQGRQWNPKSTNPTPWDLFTRIEKDVPGGSQVGNTHFPPNGTHDYDYGNNTLVKSYAENWYRYPYLLDQYSNVNVSTWYYKLNEPLAEGKDQLGYLIWMYDHVPRYVGVTDGILNNWWNYVVDYEGAIELAKNTPVVGVIDQTQQIPTKFKLEQNYPNPFNPSTTIEYIIPQMSSGNTIPVHLRLYDVLGNKIKDLVNRNQQPGNYKVYLNVPSLSSGIYFYQLRAGNFLGAKKMILLK